MISRVGYRNFLLILYDVFLMPDLVCRLEGSLEDEGCEARRSRFGLGTTDYRCVRGEYDGEAFGVLGGSEDYDGV